MTQPADPKPAPPPAVPAGGPPPPGAAGGTPGDSGVAATKPTELGGPKGLDPVRYGDWERDGRCVDF
ncbi:MAG: DUF1674 domain-containing protein [Alphaproteobacteria bacterium]|nr:DUF1674 domain-containing protein [Alphaproteobacteria bacterium]